MGTLVCPVLSIAEKGLSSNGKRKITGNAGLICRAAEWVQCSTRGIKGK